MATVGVKGLTRSFSGTLASASTTMHQKSDCGSVIYQTYRAVSAVPAKLGLYVKAVSYETRKPRFSICGTK